MKKIVALVLMLCLLLSVSLAEDVDLSKYTDNELNLLIQRINEELAGRKGTEYWFDYGLGQYIPKIELVSRRMPELDSFVTNTDKHFYITVKGTTNEDFENYILKLTSFGFTNKVKRSNIEFNAENEMGIAITMINFSSSGISIKAKR